MCGILAKGSGKPLIHIPHNNNIKNYFLETMILFPIKCLSLKSENDLKFKFLLETIKNFSYG